MVGGGRAGAESQLPDTHWPSDTYPAVPCNSGDADGGTEMARREGHSLDGGDADTTVSA